MGVATLAKTVKVPRLVVEVKVDPLTMKQFSVAEYHKLIEIGVLKSSEPYELLEGWIVKKMPINPAQASSIRKLTASLMSRFHPEWVVSVQLPITTARSEPEPNIVIAEGPYEKYDARHPSPLESELVIEVSSSSLSIDRGFKLGVYASAKVPQYWVVNLIHHRVEVYTKPKAGKNPTYKSRVDYVKGDEIPLVLAGKPVGTLPVSEFLA